MNDQLPVPDKQLVHWRIVKASPVLLELIDANFDQDEAWPKMSMSIKWDGCCHLHEHMPEPETGQYWHLCGRYAFDEMIARLQEARQIAIANFSPRNEEWKPRDEHPLALQEKYVPGPADPKFEVKA